MGPAFLLQQGIGRIANFKRNLENNPRPQSHCWFPSLPVLWQVKLLSLAHEGRQIPETLSPNFSQWQQDRHCLTQSPPGSSSLALVGLCRWEKIWMGTSPPCPLPAAVFPKESVNGHEPAWVCRALGTACWEGQCRQDVRGHEPWICRSRWEKEVVGLVSMMSRDLHMHEFVSMAVQASCVEGFGAGLLCQGVLFYQASTFMVNNLCHHPSWESKNELTCAPQAQYLPSFQQRKQSLVRYN